MRTHPIFGLVLLGSLLAFAAPACVDAEPGEDGASDFAAQAIKLPLDTPTLSAGGETQTSIEVNVCAGDSGAPAGFSVQWEPLDSYNANGWNSESIGYCAASFSGVPSGSIFSLDPGECVTVPIGDLDAAEIGLSFEEGCNAGLVCGTTYAFRAFAHATPSFGRSAFTATLFHSTAACDLGCTFPQGYWKTHDGTPQPNVWPAGGLTLGTTNYYSQAQLSLIFDKPVQGNGLISLAHQLIAAKLNIASGADPSAISATIASADALIGSLIVPPIAGGGYLSPASTSALTTVLSSYNTGSIGPGSCE